MELMRSAMNLKEKYASESLYNDYRKMLNSELFITKRHTFLVNNYIQFIRKFKYLREIILYTNLILFL